MKNKYPEAQKSIVILGSKATGKTVACIEHIKRYIKQVKHKDCKVIVLCVNKIEYSKPLARHKKKIHLFESYDELIDNYCNIKNCLLVIDTTIPEKDYYINAIVSTNKSKKVSTIVTGQSFKSIPYTIYANCEYLQLFTEKTPNQAKCDLLGCPFDYFFDLADWIIISLLFANEGRSVLINLNDWTISCKEYYYFTKAFDLACYGQKYTYSGLSNMAEKIIQYAQHYQKEIL